MMETDRRKEVDVGTVVRRLGPTLRPFLPKFGWGIVLILISTAMEILLPIVIGRSVDAAIAPAPETGLLFRLCGAYLLLILGKSVVESIQAYVIQSTGQGVTHELRSRLFGKVETLPVAYFDRNPTGRLVTRVINDIKSLSELFTASISVLALDIMIILGTIVAMFWMHWRLAAIVLMTFPLVLITIKYFGTKLALAYRTVRLKLSEINAFLGENIGAIATIQRLGAEKERLGRFEGIVEGHTSAQMASLRVFATVQPIANVLNGISMGTLLAVGGVWVIEGHIKLGVLVAFFAYLRNLFQPIRDLVEKYNTFLSAMVAAERVVGLMDEPSEAELSLAPPREISPDPLGIRFDGVSFSYFLRLRPAVQGVSFTIPPGKSLAVVGATGSGKSTLVRLLLRFYEPDEGGILLGDRPIRDYDRRHLRQLIGVVHQEIYLFHGTLRENLGLGRDHFTDAYLQAQCERVQLWKFVKGRGGLDMPIREGGTNLSLGERQLISFARILVLDTPVLILDEATSSVDRILERRLMEAVRETIAGRTSIVIAHRLSTIRHCDGILVLDHGKVVEEGSYDQLLHHNGLFAKFHEIHAGA